MSGARLYRNVFVMAAALSGMFASSAFAQGGGGLKQGQQGTLGGVISNTYMSLTNVPTLLTLFAYIFALMLAVRSLIEFKDHVDSPNNTPLSQPIKKFIAAGCLFALPYLSSAIAGSLFKEGAGALRYGSRHELSASGTGAGLDHMVYNFVNNIYGPMTSLLAVFSYLAAVILLIVGISRLIKTAQDGPQGPTGLGTIATFLVVGVLFSLGGMMGSFNSSLFAKEGVSTFATIGSNIISDNSDRERIAMVIEAVMMFVMLVGYIAFIRGWFVLRSFADGNGQASIAQALTFLIGGTLAINLGELVNVLQRTLGINPGNAISFQ